MKVEFSVSLQSLACAFFLCWKGVQVQFCFKDYHIPYCPARKNPYFFGLFADLAEKTRGAGAPFSMFINGLTILSPF
jgi:hypothetical protein